MIAVSVGENIIAAGCAQHVSFCWCRAGIRNTCLAPVTVCFAETLLAIIKACILPGTTFVSAGGTMFVSAMMDSHTTPSIAPLFLWYMDGDKNDDAIWMHAKVNIGPY